MFLGPPETFSDRATSAQVLFLCQDVVCVPVAIGTADDSHRTPTEVPSLPTGEILIAYSYTGESARHQFDFSLNTQPVSGNCGWDDHERICSPVISRTRDWGDTTIELAGAQARVCPAPRRKCFRSGRQHQAGGRIEGQLRAAMVLAKIEHTVELPGFRIRGVGADSAEVPIILDEAQDRRLIGRAMIDVVLLCIRRNHQQWQTRTITAAAL